MSAAVLRPSLKPRGGLPQRVHWTCDAFHDLCDSGTFEGREVILIDGEILERPPPKPPHNVGVMLTLDILQSIAGIDRHVRPQMAFDIGTENALAPDLALVAGMARDDATRQPTTADLIVEVADSSLAYDTGAKATLYASAGIGDYWVLDLNDRMLHVYRDPVTDAAEPRGWRYASHTMHDAAEAVSPLALPTATVRIADLLP